MTTEEIQAIGILWFKDEARYREYKRIITDPDALGNNYTSWMFKSQKFINLFESNGFHVIKIEAEVSEFVHWCTLHGISLNSTGLKRFASFKTHYVPPW